MKIEGDQKAYFEFLSKQDKFEFWFKIVEP